MAQLKLEVKNPKKDLTLKLGLKLREQFNLDELDKNDDIIYIDVSKKITSIPSVFFGYLFGKSIKYLGVAKFNTKYRFITGTHNQKIISEHIQKCAMYLT